MGQDLVFGVQKELVLAVATGVFAVVALVLFIRDMLHGGSRPYLWAWVIRGGIVVVAFLTQLLQGATYSLALAGGQLLIVVAVIGFIIALQPRMGRLDRADWAVLGVASVGVAWWVTSGNPLFGLLGVILADTCATGMAIRASVQKGTEESIPFWTCAFMAATMAAMAAGTADWIILLAPLFSCLNATANILSVIYVRRSKTVLATEPVEVEADPS